MHWKERVAAGTIKIDTSDKDYPLVGTVADLTAMITACLDGIGLKLKPNPDDGRINLLSLRGEQSWHIKTILPGESHEVIAEIQGFIPESQTVGATIWGKDLIRTVILKPGHKIRFNWVVRGEDLRGHGVRLGLQTLTDSEIRELSHPEVIYDILQLKAIESRI